MGIRTYPDTPKIFLDMDGVVADFEAYGIEKHKHPQELKLIPGTYFNLPPFPGALEGVRELQNLGFFVMMLTKIPSKNPYAAAEKIMWLERHLPSIHDHVIITPNKGAVGTSIDFLVDDHPEWANAHSFPGQIVRFNKEPEHIEHRQYVHLSTWPDLVDYFTKVKQG